MHGVDLSFDRFAHANQVHMGSLIETGNQEVRVLP